MTNSTYRKQRTVWIGTCWFTAILNAVFSPGYAQGTTEGETSSEGAVAENVLRYGIFDVRPTIQGGITYDDNIYTGSGLAGESEVEDLIWTIAPGLTLGAGDYQEFQDNLLLLSYTPSLNFFTHNSKENAVDHDAKIAGRYISGRWTFSLQQTYIQRHDPTVDANTRVDRDYWTTDAGARFELSPKTALDIFGTAAFVENGEASTPTATIEKLCYNDFSGGVGLDYAITPKVTVGPAFKAGWLDYKDTGTSLNTDQTYQQGLVRVNYLTTEKVKIRASAGVEFRQFDDPTVSGDDSEVNPVLELGATYRPLEQTFLNLDAYRREQPSQSQSGNYSATGFALGVRQTFREFYAINLRTGFEFLDYDVGDREDCYYFGRLAFEWQPTDKIVGSVWYQYRQNDSDQAVSEYDNNQFGLTLAYRF